MLSYPDSHRIIRYEDSKGNIISDDIFELFLGVPFDPQLDSFATEFSCERNCTKLMAWDETIGKVFVQNTIASGNYTIILNMVDDNENPKEIEYEINLEVIDV